MRRIVFLFALIYVAYLNGCDRPTYAMADVPSGKAVPRPIDAAWWALEDVRTLSAVARPYARYVWTPPHMAMKESAQVNSFAVNTAASRATSIVLPAMSAKGWIIRWDLRALGGSDKGLADVLNTWEKLAESEPYFHAQIVRNGKRTIGSATHAGQQHRDLSAETGSIVPIVRADWLLTKMLTSLDGGLYYEFAGIERKPSKGTAQEAWLRNLGADEKLAEQVNGDQRAALFFSHVTSKPRRVDFFRGVAGRSNTGLVTITHDIADGEVAAGAHPIRNLLAFKDAAREAIAERQNGLHSFALFDGQGNLQDAAPDNIVCDHQIPPPYTRRLEACISCIRCHGPDEGWKPVANDIQALLKARSLDVFADLTNVDDVAAVLDRLAGLYSGNLDKPLTRARDDYQDAVRKATSGLDASKAAALLSDQFAAYRYELVSPKQVLLELGIRPDSKQSPVVALRWLVPHLPADERGVSPEDPVIGSLLSGLSVNRGDLEQVYADLMSRTSAKWKEWRNATR